MFLPSLVRSNFLMCLCLIYFLTLSLIKLSGGARVLVPIRLKVCLLLFFRKREVLSLPNILLCPQQCYVVVCCQFYRVSLAVGGVCLMPSNEFDVPKMLINGKTDCEVLTVKIKIKLNYLPHQTMIVYE